VEQFLAPAQSKPAARFIEDKSRLLKVLKTAVSDQQNVATRS